MSREEDEYDAVYALTNLGHGFSVSHESAATDALTNDEDSEPESIEVNEPNTKFPLKLFDILDSQKHSDMIQWLPQGNGFFFVDKKRFEAEVLPLFFKKRTKFTSFTRRLIRWGFTRVARGTFLGSYFHSLFQQGKRSLCVELCKRLRNKKAKHSLNKKEDEPDRKVDSKERCSSSETNESTVDRKVSQTNELASFRPICHDKDSLMYLYYAHNKGQEVKKLIMLRLLEHKRQQLMLQNQYMQMIHVHKQQRLLTLLSKTSADLSRQPKPAAAVQNNTLPVFPGTHHTVGDVNNIGSIYGAYAA